MCLEIYLRLGCTLVEITFLFVNIA